MVRAPGRGREARITPLPPRYPTRPIKVHSPRPLQLVTRAEWSALPWVPQDTDVRLRFPIMHMRHTFTDTEECHNPDECIPFLQRLQRDSQAKGFPDLMYNFLIGSDGTLYEGRGFDWKCTVFADPWVDVTGESMNIAFIGKFHNVQAPVPFRVAAKTLSKWMVRNALLHHDHTMTPSICWPEDYATRPNIKVKHCKGPDLQPECQAEAQEGMAEGGWINLGQPEEQTPYEQPGDILDDTPEDIVDEYDVE